MKIEFFRYSSTVRTGLMLAAGFGLMVAGIPTPVRAANLVLQGSTVASCTYSAASMDASGNLTITTSSSCGLQAPADTLAFATPPTTVGVNGNVNVTITRSNPVGASITGTVSSTNGCTVSNGGIAGFSGTSASTALTITAPAAATTCTISLVAGTGANLGTPNTFDLTVTAVQPDVVALSGVPPTLAAAASGTFSVTRTGTNSVGGVTATVGVTGGCTLSASTANFAGTTTTPVSFTITAPNAAATCPVTLAAGAGATLGSPNSATVSVSAPPPPPPPPTTGTCTTSAASNQDVRGTTRFSVIMAGSATAPATTASKFRAPGDAKTLGRMSSVQAVNFVIPPNIEGNISECPGDFTPRSADCYQYNPQGENVMFLWGTSGSGAGYCLLDPTKTYYLNMRTWANGTFGVQVDNQ